MSIKIHYGPPGSYKTSGAVQDDFIPAVLEGRPIVTNVRGLDDEENIKEVIGSLRGGATNQEWADEFQLIYVDTTNARGRAKLAMWFHWVPTNAFLLIDEAQFIWPTKPDKGFIESLAYPGGLDAATRDERPVDHYTAFDMHRHYNWDMVLTTPNITKIRPEIRDVAEGAYKHKNQALLGLPGLRGRYLEAFHLAADNGTKTSFISVRQRKIKSHVWKLYKSTATGQTSDTKAGISILGNPRLLLVLGFIAVVLVFVAGGDFSALPGFSSDEGAVTSDRAVIPDNRQGAVQDRPIPVKNSGVPADRVVPVAVPGPYDRYVIRLIGYIKNEDRDRYLFQFYGGGPVVIQSDKQLEKLGYTVTGFSECSAVIRWKDAPAKTVTCIDPIIKEKSDA